MFVDDNITNLKEAEFALPRLKTLLPDDFLKMDLKNLGKDDPKRRQLAQYKLLEKKASIKKERYINDNSAFLNDANIEVDLIALTETSDVLERIYELINKANQLNFTKSRFSLYILFVNYITSFKDTYAVSVRDKYGDYGIVGFVSFENKAIQHFVFSCRILGMEIESIIMKFLQLENPFQFKSSPSFTNYKIGYKKDLSEAGSHQNAPNNLRLLAIGACELTAIGSFIPFKFEMAIALGSTGASLLNLMYKKEDCFESLITSNAYDVVVINLSHSFYNFIFKESKRIKYFYAIDNFNFHNYKIFVKKSIQNMETMLNSRILVKRNAYSDNFPSEKLKYVNKRFLAVAGLLCYSFFGYPPYIVQKAKLRKIEPQELRKALALFSDLVRSQNSDAKIFYLTPFVSDGNQYGFQENRAEKERRIADLNEVVRSSLVPNKDFILDLNSILVEADIDDADPTHFTRKGYLKVAECLLQLLPQNNLSRPA